MGVVAIGEHGSQTVTKHAPLWNPVAEDSNPAGWLSANEPHLSKLIHQGIEPKPLLVCSGGTSSRCAADGLWTLDLRVHNRQLLLSEHGDEVEIGTGLSMAEVLESLQCHGRSIPVGLSTLPGCGFVLTGGIGPLTRSQGLAMDHVVGLRGVWGNGQSFQLSAPPRHQRVLTESPSKQLIRKTWRGLLGAAPFLAIITAIQLRTNRLQPLAVWRSRCDVDELAAAIKVSEQWTHSASLQWAWSDNIELYVTCCADDTAAMNSLGTLRRDFGSVSNGNLTIIPGQHAQPHFGTLARSRSTQERLHSEVFSRLGPVLGDTIPTLITKLTHLMRKRPHPGCQISAQQLGGKSSQIPVEETSFIHRESIWKPWITATWPAGDGTMRQKGLQWLTDANELLTEHFPGVHLAQIHPHLSFHSTEIEEAFGDWLPGLKQLKSTYDPEGLLPPL